MLLFWLIHSLCYYSDFFTRHVHIMTYSLTTCTYICSYTDWMGHLPSLSSNLIRHSSSSFSSVLKFIFWLNHSPSLYYELLTHPVYNLIYSLTWFTLGLIWSFTWLTPSDVITAAGTFRTICRTQAFREFLVSPALSNMNVHKQNCRTFPW